MGEVEIIKDSHQIFIHSILIIYGEAATELLAHQMAADVSAHWNQPGAKVLIKKKSYAVQFNISGEWSPFLAETDVLSNTDPRKNYFRIEAFSRGNISSVDAINSNTGYFQLDNLLNNSTTAAHEYGHSIGLDHPANLDIRGMGAPGIMYPRGTLVDPEFQYDPNAKAGEKGGTLNPFTRRVTQHDIDHLHLDKLKFDHLGKAVLGDFSSVWHEKQIPQ